MGFSPNKTAIEIIIEDAFGGTYFRDTYSGINRKWFKNSWKDDKKQINRWKKVVSRFKGKLVKMIKDAGSKFEFSDYSILPKVRQILLHWDYELTEEDFLNELTN